MIPLNLKDNLPVHVQDMLVYLLPVEYFGQTTRFQSRRIKEHKPSWFSTGARKIMTKVPHLVDIKVSITPTREFTALYKAPVKQPRLVQIRSITMAEQKPLVLGIIYCVDRSASCVL